MTAWQLRNGALDLDRPGLMGVLNVTPDSFSDGGELENADAVVRRAHSMIADGAAMLDVGGESTRPGAPAVPTAVQIERVVPAIRSIRDAGIAAPISIDTTDAEVARAGLDAGADAINDVSGGEADDAMLSLAAETGCGIVLMHRLTLPAGDTYSDQYEHGPTYRGGVVGWVAGYLHTRARAAIDAGVHPGAIVLDTGLGFGKTVEQNYELIAGTGRILALGYPVLAASSRKSFIGAVTVVDTPSQRVTGSVAAAVAQVLAGARLVRCHDVRAHAEGLAVAAAVLDASRRLEPPRE